MPGGRPLEILRIVDDKGTTVGDQIVRAVRQLGAGPEAAAAAGMNRRTYYDLLTAGRQATYRRARGERLSRRDRVLAEFSHQIVQAYDEWHLQELGRLAQAEAGGWIDEHGKVHGPAEVTVIERVLKGDDGEQVIERTTRTKALPGDSSITRWRLSKALPGLFGDRVEIDVRATLGLDEHTDSGEGAAPGSDLLTTLEAMIRRRRESETAMAAIDVASTEAGSGTQN